MSLIQEGLKRKLDEQKSLPTPTVASPSVPPPLVPPPVSGGLPPLKIALPPEGPRKGGGGQRRAKILFLALLLLLVAIAVAGGWWFLLRTKPADEVIPPPSPAAVSTNRSTGDLSAKLSTVASAVTERVLTTLEGSSDLGAKNATNAPALDAVPARTDRVEGVKSGEGVKPSAKESSVSPPAPARPKAKWPALSVSGIISGDRSGASVLINGRILREGQSIEGVVVKSVLGRQVTLEFEGETRSISSGQSIK